jgi:hypothetical protein
VHGDAGGTLQRKISTNLGLSTTTPYNFLIPLIVAGLGLLLLKPERFGAGALAGLQTVPLLKGCCVTIWIRLTGLVRGVPASACPARRCRSCCR